ncbi:MAG: Fur family transcriptional regulator [Acidobacteriota bacterium]
MPTDPAEFLHLNGLQVTAQRLAVLHVVSTLPHSTAEAVARAARAEIGAISRQSVYDTLSLLVEKRLIRRIQPVGSPARYEARVGDNHHHLICRVCGRMVDVDCAVGATPCLTASESFGYEIDEAEVVYWGRCPECAAKAQATARGTIPARGRRGGAEPRLAKPKPAREPAPSTLSSTDTQVSPGAERRKHHGQ